MQPLLGGQGLASLGRAPSQEERWVVFNIIREVGLH